MNTKRETDFDTLFLSYHDGLFRLLFRVTGSRQESEDLVQETFLRFHEHRDSIHPAKIKSWLFQVAMNLGLNLLRRRKSRTRRHQELFETKQGQQITVQNPAELAWVRETLQQLPERQARLLLLYTAGFRRVEMAEALEISPASVGQLLLRAKRAFQKAYEVRSNV